MECRYCNGAGSIAVEEDYEDCLDCGGTGVEEDEYGDWVVAPMKEISDSLDLILPKTRKAVGRLGEFISRASEIISEVNRDKARAE